MGRFTTASAVSAAAVMGLTLLGSPAAASPGSKVPGVEDTVVREGVISGEELLKQQGLDGIRYGAKKAAAIKKGQCRWYERTQGRRASKKGRWLIWIKVRLHWCYNGYQVTSAKAKYRWYTYDRYTWRWRGWGQKRLIRNNAGNVTARGKGRFYYTGNGYTYKPYIYLRGSYDGSGRWWAGG
jgi:hypothetical protein